MAKVADGKWLIFSAKRERDGKLVNRFTLDFDFFFFFFFYRKGHTYFDTYLSLRDLFINIVKHHLVLLTHIVFNNSVL